MKPHRTRRTILGIVIALLVAGWLRPQGHLDGSRVESFWYRKMIWSRQFDIVVAGDSRVLCGVSPAKMRERFPDRRIGNAAFRLAGYSKRYLDYAGSLLDPLSKRRILVLGIDPHTLTPNAARDIGGPTPWQSLHPWRPAHYNVQFESEFLYLSSQPPAQIRLRLALAPFFDTFARLHPTDLARIVGMYPHSEYRAVAHDDGWFAVHVPPGQDDRVLRTLPLLFAGNQVSPRLVEQLARAVRELRGWRIGVYGFIPPTGPLVEEIEHRLSGFSEPAVRGAFEAAGGVWLELPKKEYTTFDGHHLLDTGALDFSEDLARAIESQERKLLY